MMWEWHVACVGTRNAYRVLVGKYEGERLLEDLGMDGKMILK
jgi:hypothetical protein